MNNTLNEAEIKAGFKLIDPPESKRIYNYPTGEQLVFEGVYAVRVSDSGNHYLSAAKNRKAVIKPGWHWIEITAEHWVFWK